MAYYKTIGDWLFNREFSPSLSKPKTDIFRSVEGRFSPAEDAPPVRVVNRDSYDLSQANLTLIAANTEYTVQGIQTLSAINVKARGGDVQLSFYEGQSNLIYTLILDGTALEISTVPFGEIGKPITLYVQSPIAGTVLEILGMRV